MVGCPATRLRVRCGSETGAEQFQLDVYGELIDAMFQSQKYGVPMEQNTWNLEQALVGFLETGWHRPDDGIWEMRGPRRQFTHSKVMAWVAFDRMVKAVERFGLDGPVDRWRTPRHDYREVCHRGIDSDRNCFVQYYGAKDLDASLLMIPLVGFLPATDRACSPRSGPSNKNCCTMAL